MNPSDSINRWSFLGSQRAYLPSKNSREELRAYCSGWRAGKALALDTPVPTQSGWKTMGTLKLGDVLFDERGAPCKVVFATETMYDRDCYEVVFDDGTKVIADSDHLWATQTPSNRHAVSALRRAGISTNGTITTRQVKDSLVYNRMANTPTHCIPVSGAVRLPRRELLIDPYVLGAWLGDGASNSGVIYASNADYEVIRNVMECGYAAHLVPSSLDGTVPAYRIAGHETLTTTLRTLGVLNNKYIPDEYLFGSTEQRWSLLQGLMDTDGYAEKKRPSAEFVSTRKALALGVLSLLRSLGFKPAIREAKSKLNGKIHGPAFRIRFSCAGFPQVFRLRRKRDCVPESAAKRQYRGDRRWITSVKECASVPVRCIQVDSSSHLYLVSESFIATHNTIALCRAGVLLSYLVPDNLGFMGRASGKDMENTLYETFFNQVCPPALILDQKKIGQTGRMVVLRTTDPRRPSRIYMDYIIDREADRSHFAGGDWGWFGVSQAEEITRNDFNKLLGRLSRNVPRNYALLEANLSGHNWIYDEFYSGGDCDFPLGDPALYKVVRKSNHVGVVSRSEENKVSSGGFVKDSYFSRLREVMPPDWIARQLDSSFEDFSGKIYKGYNLNSVHNIDPFPIPDHWAWLIPIDPGGSDATCVAPMRIDTEGNLIIVDEFYRPNVNPYTIITWMREHIPVKDCRFVIDYENRLFTIQLQDEFGIACEPAIKDVYAGCQQAATYFWPVPGRSLPTWYEKTQPKAQYERFKDGGAPRIYLMKGKCPHVARSCDSYMWDDKHPNQPKPGDDHGADTVRYACQSRPLPARRSAREEEAWRSQHDPLRHLATSPASYESAKYMHTLIEQAKQDELATRVGDFSSDGMYKAPELGSVALIDEFM